MQRYVNVSRSMKKNGYLPEKSKDSIRVMIGRNGQIIKEGKGRHRLAIAKLLSIDKVIVKITHIHPKWLEKQQKTIQKSVPWIDLLNLSLKKLERSCKASPDN